MDSGAHKWGALSSGLTTVMLFPDALLQSSPCRRCTTGTRMAWSQSTSTSTGWRTVRQEEIDFKIGLLNRLTSSDPPLPFPHSSQVDGQLRELRCHYGRDLYRILYQRSGNLFVLLHMIEKRTGALPQAEIDVAKARFVDSATGWTRSPAANPDQLGMTPHQTRCHAYQN